MSTAEASPELLSEVREWIDHDVDDSTRAELTALYDAATTGDAAAIVDLESRFSGPLEFGTAGLRGEVAAGPARMNRATVIRATAGVAAHLRNLVGADFVVVLGCDARHGSTEFYRDAAAVISAAGGRALVLPPQLPTPVTAFAVRHLGADAGIMVTASHNPPRDNGYKVYLGGRAVTEDARRGVQIIAPHDREIAAAIAAAPPADQVARNSTSVVPVGPEVIAAYRDHAAAQVGHSTAAQRAALKVVITAMHGVGGATIVSSLHQAGFSDVLPVVEQFEPDPDFPTVAFPNPEEAGALDLAIATASSHGADVIIAADPDADRCSVAIPDTTATTGWRQLSGDEIGALLGEAIAAQADSESTLANSIVSSRLLSKIAAHHGLNYRATLTGFKWIAGVENLVFGYEEAIGYCCAPESVRDKDGVSAAVRVADLAAALKAQGRTLADALDDLARVHGLYRSAPLTFRVTDRSVITSALATLRATPPEQLVGSPVTEFVDLTEGLELSDERGQRYQLPGTDGIMLLTEAGDRVIVRPSGTEPKLKCYLEVIVPLTGDTVPHAEATARVERLAAELRATLDM